MAPIIRGTRIVHDGWSRFLVAEVTMTDGTRLAREIEDHGRAVAVLPYDPVRRVALLVEQFRTPAFYAAGITQVLEVPAGLLDESEPEDGARREAYEETGVRLGGPGTRDLRLEHAGHLHRADGPLPRAPTRRRIGQDRAADWPRSTRPSPCGRYRWPNSRA